ncbi:acyl-CoA dehydrogenase family member 10 [Verticillium alfalfae VaMs.102]|uniref:Acyl-CoA dehydrogenase family member 10 n=1 Tax=Verticillium alfalfae (strain VaMs.102 / ATCC MYA-4576 / FGSC 10136) TaxID=526221 RepID=C9SF65_VERA1|nr:acyl-CoA dehydrogenase family member 10 [Verticillium alfalfae VaMs.102]EEY17851.1 acyl-CoA dehydrogenase family member 10 [Verticillium alfalfae VaMs.102]
MSSASERRNAVYSIFSLPNHFKESPGLTNLEYSCCAEIMGRCYWAAQTMNCHAPETGNIELLAKYCSPEQKAKWLQPLLDGTASSAYSMTEPDVASSDATQIGISIRRDGDEYVINGRKLYGNCLWNKELSFYILMGCTAPDHPDKWRRHSMLIVPCDTPGITQVRNLTIMGYDHAPEGHGEYKYDNVRVPVGNVILGEGRAFEIAQGRLGARPHPPLHAPHRPVRARLRARPSCAASTRAKSRAPASSATLTPTLSASPRCPRVEAARLRRPKRRRHDEPARNKAGKRAIAPEQRFSSPELAAPHHRRVHADLRRPGPHAAHALPEMWTYSRFVARGGRAGRGAPAPGWAGGDEDGTGLPRQASGLPGQVQEVCRAVWGEVCLF